MATETRYLYNDEDVSYTLNQGKDIFIRFLADEGYIKEDNVQKLVENHMLMCKKPSMISRVWSSFSGKKKDEAFIFVTKIINAKEVKEKLQGK